MTRSKRLMQWNILTLFLILVGLGCGAPNEDPMNDGGASQEGGTLLDAVLDAPVQDDVGGDVASPSDGGRPSDATGVDAVCSDDDSDSVCNDVDRCPGFDDRQDSDADGVPDGCDPDDLCAAWVGPSLVACYNFDGDLLDSSANANHGSSAGPNEFIETPFGQGVIPGPEAIAVPDSPSLDVENITVEAWLRIDQYPSSRSGAIVLDNDAQYGLVVASSRRTHSFLHLPDGVALTGRRNVLPPTGQWVHYALTFDGTEMVHYVDGVAVRRAPAVGTIATDNTNPMHLGTGSPATTFPFRGVLDAIRIWSVARTPQEMCESAGRVWMDDVCQPRM